MTEDDDIKPDLECKPNICITTCNVKIECDQDPKTEKDIKIEYEDDNSEEEHKVDETEFVITTNTIKTEVPDFTSDVEGVIKKEEAEVDNISESAINDETSIDSNLLDPLDVKDRSDFLVQCPHCEINLENNEDLETHVKDCSESTSRSDGENTQLKKFKCDVCSKRFKTSSNLKDHRQLHSDEKPYACEKCSYRTKWKHCLQSHYSIHEDVKKVQCEICSKQFKTHTHLKKHRQFHIDEKSYLCEKCPYKTKWKQSLQAHSRIHDVVETVQCDLCAKQFKTLAYLRKHRYSHSDRKPYSCEKCDYTTKWKQSLQTHCRIHEEVEKIQCDVCFKQFKTQSYFKKHLQFHADEQF